MSWQCSLKIALHRIQNAMYKKQDDFVASVGSATEMPGPTINRLRHTSYYVTYISSFFYHNTYIVFYNLP